MSTHDGGPAFPRQLKQVDNPIDFERHELRAQSGMSLRDYFAAHAPNPFDPMQIEDHCAFRYRFADAMLAERAKKEPTHDRHR